MFRYVDFPVRFKRKVFGKAKDRPIEAPVI